METVITIPVRLRDLKKEDLIAAVERREKYALVRDLQAEEFNRAIVSRLAKDRAIVSRLTKDREIVSRLTKDREKLECSQNVDREIQSKLRQGSGKFQRNVRDMLEIFRINSEKIQSRQRKI
jgi:hypothetical protein